MMGNHGLRGYKLCKECGSPLLKKVQKRKHKDDYRHARGCPAASKREHDATERFWAEYDADLAAAK